MQHRIAKALQNIGKSNEELAQILGVNRNTIAAYKNSKGDLKGIVLVGLAKKFGYNPDWLLTGEGEMFADKAPRPRHIGDRPASVHHPKSNDSQTYQPLRPFSDRQAETLARVIRMVEEEMARTGKRASPEKKAELILQIFSSLVQTTAKLPDDEKVSCKEPAEEGKIE
ncbi:XRE family transcriptional regulato [Desulfonema ishimotonii]|uniref:XRE family transcriptional regulato n=1 Tax=Desulfonema ishimotonii TaxID=45657 RepID=A0A401FZX5_9BACT|nr:XRE family transcriptional regulato [Desulfonema ishimotonii]